MPVPAKLRMPDDVRKLLSHLPPSLKGKVRYALDQLLKNFHEGKPLKAELSGLWSLRVGKFRIIYRPADTVLEIIAVGPRSTIYRDISNRLSRRPTLG